MTARCALGSERELRGEFSLADGSPIDPDTLMFEVREPSGQVTTFTYPGPEIERLSTGLFRVFWTFRRAGTHYFRWAANDGIVVAGEGECGSSTRRYCSL
jgi:hypothetical protein